MFAIVYFFNCFDYILLKSLNYSYLDKKTENYSSSQISNYKKLYNANKNNKLTFKINSMLFFVIKNNFYYKNIINFFLSKKINVKDNNNTLILNNLNFNYNSSNNLTNFFFSDNTHRIANNNINLIKSYFNFDFFQKQLVSYLNFFNKKINLNSNYFIKFSVSDFFKNLNGLTLNYMNVLFLRKNKVFNKGRYSRNRQYYRTGVY